jgi:hypothetical protein
MVNFWKMEHPAYRARTVASTLLGMAVDPHIAPDLCDQAVGADQNRRPNDSHEVPAVHRFFAPGTIRLEHLVLLIRDQRNRKLVLGGKRLLCLYGVRGDAEHLGSCVGKVALEAGEIDGFPGAAGGIGAGIEEQHQLFTRMIGQRDIAAAIAGQAEGGRDGPLDQLGSPFRGGWGR